MPLRHGSSRRPAPPTAARQPERLDADRDAAAPGDPDVDAGAARSPLRGREGSEYTGLSYGQSGRGDGPARREAARDDWSPRPAGTDAVGGRAPTRTRARFGPHTGLGPRGYTRSDARIKEEVSDELMADGEVNASAIEVDVTGGEVTLAGTVDSRDAKRRAEALVDMIPGVRNVHNALRIDAGGADEAQRPSSPATLPRRATSGGPQPRTDRPTPKRR